MQGLCRADEVTVKSWGTGFLPQVCQRMVWNECCSWDNRRMEKRAWGRVAQKALERKAAVWWCAHQGAKACDENTGAGRHTAELLHGPLKDRTLSSLALASRVQSFETVNRCCRRNLICGASLQQPQENNITPFSTFSLNRLLSKDFKQTNRVFFL